MRDKAERMSKAEKIGEIDVYHNPHTGQPQTVGAILFAKGDTIRVTYLDGASKTYYIRHLTYDGPMRLYCLWLVQFDRPHRLRGIRQRERWSTHMLHSSEALLTEKHED